MKYTNHGIQQEIESYLRQEMTDLERAGFERRMHEDAGLYEEVKKQDVLISAIRRERMLELKSGLQGIQISLWSATAMEYARIAAISAGIGLASLGGYLYLQKQDKPLQLPKSEYSVQKLPELKSEKTETVDTKLSTSVPELPEVQSDKPAGGLKSSPGPNSKVSETAATKVSPETELEEPAFKTVLPATPEGISLPEDGISHKTAPESMQPEVVIKRDNRDKFHYQFMDGKLVLYADFNEKLYEVLELNQHGQKQLYLSYDGKFYALNPEVSEITPMTQVTNKDLLQILAVYQKRK